MKAIKDFRAGVGAHRDLCIRGPFNGSRKVFVNPATILYNYYNDAAYNAPDWATDFGPTANDGDSTFGAMLNNGYGPGQCINPGQKVTSFSLDEFENALYKEVLHSTFFNEGFSGQTYSLATVLAPTKFLHWFFNSTSGLDGLYEDTKNYWPVGNINSGYSLRHKIPVDSVIDGIGSICVNTYGIFDLEEKGTRQNSPGTPFILPYELNFVPFGYESAQFFEPFCFLVNVQTTPFSVMASEFPSGHWFMDHFTYCDGYTGGDPRIV